MAPNWVRLAPNGTNLGLFKISFQFILALRAKMNCKLILKSPRLVPFSANLTRSCANSDFPEAQAKQNLPDSCSLSELKLSSRLRLSLSESLSRSFRALRRRTVGGVGVWGPGVLVGECLRGELLVPAGTDTASLSTPCGSVLAPGGSGTESLSIEFDSALLPNFC